VPLLSSGFSPGALQPWYLQYLNILPSSYAVPQVPHFGGAPAAAAAAATTAAPAFLFSALNRSSKDFRDPVPSDDRGTPAGGAGGGPGGGPGSAPPRIIWSPPPIIS
jgi:hypothetical protein